MPRKAPRSLIARRNGTNRCLPTLNIIFMHSRAIWGILEHFHKVSDSCAFILSLMLYTEFLPVVLTFSISSLFCFICVSHVYVCLSWSVSKYMFQSIYPHEVRQPYSKVKELISPRVHKSLSLAFSISIEDY